jgi:hypothetical protein
MQAQRLPQQELEMTYRTFATQPIRPIFFRVGKDTGVFYDLKTLKGALARLYRAMPDAREYEVQYGAPLGTDAGAGESQTVTK